MDASEKEITTCSCRGTFDCHTSFALNISSLKQKTALPKGTFGTLTLMNKKVEMLPDFVLSAGTTEPFAVD